VKHLAKMLPGDVRRSLGVVAATRRALIVPLMAIGFLTVLHWDEARALAGKGGKGTRFALRRKGRDPLSGWTRAGLLTAMLVFGALPYGEELWRCLRTRRTLGAAPEPAAPATATLRRPDEVRQ
jgi:hypothetical protein